MQTWYPVAVWFAGANGWFIDAVWATNEDEALQVAYWNWDGAEAIRLIG